MPTGREALAGIRAHRLRCTAASGLWLGQRFEPSISAILVSEMIGSGAAVSTLVTQLFKETGHFPQPWED